MDFFDIDPFVLAVLAPHDYPAAYPDCRLIRADMNSDASVDFFDVDLFVLRLIEQ